MQRQSPPKHRHDGTSPLPLGMDWSPPPRKWNGRDTVWPHDPRTGWSYCVTIPSWVVLPKSRNSDPIVFYRVQVGIQSPEGVTTTRGILRRFNDFLKLFTALRKSFPKKNLPPAPPKGLLRMKSRVLLEERRCSLEEWMAKLLSDFDISRSVAIASFLELEAAARSSFQDERLGISESNPSVSSPKSSSGVLCKLSPSMLAGSTSLTLDYGSDTAYETSEIGTSSLGRDNNSEVGLEDLSLDEDLTGPIEQLVKYGMPNIDEGLFIGQAILEQIEGFPKDKVPARDKNSGVVNSKNNGNTTEVAHNVGSISEPEHGKVISHARKLSDESVGSEISSVKGSVSSNSGFPTSFGDRFLDLARGNEASKTMEILGNMEQSSSNGQLVLPLDERQKMHRVLMTMQRRLITAKTDLEDLISRLKQEMAVKDYLTTKVKDLEGELETTKQKGRENLQQAILLEKERFTQMQWDMEELRRKSLEMELKLKSQQGNGIVLPSDATTQQFEDLLKQHQELEVKSKADIKVLVKEVKSLRSSQAQLKQQLNQSLKEKTEAERLLQQERQMSENAKTAQRKLLHECEILHNKLKECNYNLLEESADKLVLKPSSLADATNLLTTSDNQISHLLIEAQLLAREKGYANSTVNDTDHNDDEEIDDELRKMLSDIFVDNVRLRELVNSAIRHALKIDISSKKDDNEVSLNQVVQNEFTER